MSDLFVFGAGGYAKVVISTMRGVGLVPTGLLDADPAKHGTQVLGIPVLGDFELLRESLGVRAVMGIGENRARSLLGRQFAHLDWLTVIHPTAFVDESVEVGLGTVICTGAVVQPDVKIGRFCIISATSVVGHDSILEDFVHVAAGACPTGHTFLGTGVLMGSKSVTIPRSRIGAWSKIGAGAAVNAEIPAGSVAVGVPARVVKRHTRRLEESEH
jgi:sugar O-acyltransferase (sialic acid O-acetyltransferase NeuD family)